MFTLLNLILAAILAGPFYASVIGASLSADATMPGSESAAVEAAIASGGIQLILVGLYGLYVLVAFIPSIAVGVRRLHDRNMSGWWYLGFMVLSLIPLLGLLASLAFIIVMALPGTPGPNKYGPSPKEEFTAETFE